MAENADLRFRFLAEARDFLKKNAAVRKGLGQTDKQVSRSNSAFGGLRKTLGTLGVAFAGAQAVKWAGDAIQLAVAADEVDSKFQAVYGSSQDLEDSLAAWGDMAGVTTTQAKGLAATFGNLAMAQGIAKDTTKDLALDVATLAGDMASFNDADPAQVFEDINKGMLTTEREGLKKYGIAVAEAEVKQRALALATKDGRTEVTKADRALASYNIIVAQAGQAVGDLARTADSGANKQRQLRATMQELQETIGKELQPVFEDLLDVAIALAPAFKVVAAAARGAVNPVKELTDGVSTAADTSEDFGTRAKGALQAFWGEVKIALPVLRSLEDGIQSASWHMDEHFVPSMDRGAAAQGELADKAQMAAGRLGVVKGAATELAEEMEDASDRVDAAVRAWSSALADLPGAYARAAADIEAQNFLARTNLEDSGGAEERADAETVRKRRNGEPD